LQLVGGMLFVPASALLWDDTANAGLPPGHRLRLLQPRPGRGQVRRCGGRDWLAHATADPLPYLVVAVLAVASLIGLLSPCAPP
jgi:hypothetical protein